MRTGILLINLGTPSAPSISAVRAFLNEFLMDPYVVDLPFLLRWILVKGLILPTRPRQSAKAYQQIWTERGSPLLNHSLDLAKHLQSLLGDRYTVALGMRYGQPCIADALLSLSDCDRLLVLPLFPQYSLAATESAIDCVRRALPSCEFSGGVRIVKDFYDHPGLIDAFSTVMSEHMRSGYHTVFSYHGLPEKHLDKVSDCAKFCDRRAPCPQVKKKNRWCYRSQCYATTSALVNKLGLGAAQYSVAFQSRLGKTPWIQPYTETLLDELLARGVRRLQVVCPAFVADCLETLEEIEIRMKESWLSLGGEDLKLIPCLNVHPKWLQAMKSIVEGELALD